MQKLIKDACITSKKPTEFENGGRNIQIRLEDNSSFNLPEGHPLSTRLQPGMSINGSYTSETHKTTQNASGANVTWVTLNGVNITDVQMSKLSEKFAALPEIPITNWTKAGGGNTPSGGGTPDLPKP